MGTAFVIDNTAYLTGGDSVAVDPQNTWAYNIAADSWQQVSSYKNKTCFGLFGFSINDKGYAGGGEVKSDSSGTTSSFYEYTPAAAE